MLHKIRPFKMSGQKASQQALDRFPLKSMKELQPAADKNYQYSVPEIPRNYSMQSICSQKYTWSQCLSLSYHNDIHLITNIMNEIQLYQKESHLAMLLGHRQIISNQAYPPAQRQCRCSPNKNTKGKKSIKLFLYLWMKCRISKIPFARKTSTCAYAEELRIASFHDL